MYHLLTYDSRYKYHAIEYKKYEDITKPLDEHMGEKINVTYDDIQYGYWLSEIAYKIFEFKGDDEEIFKTLKQYYFGNMKGEELKKPKILDNMESENETIIKNFFEKLYWLEKQNLLLDQPEDFKIVDVIFDDYETMFYFIIEICPDLIDLHENKISFT